MPPAGLGVGHALDAVHAALEFQPRIDAPAVDLGDDFLEAANRALAHRQDLDLPAPCVGVTLVHPEKVPREERRLVAARAGADFEDHGALVGRVLGQQHEAHLVRHRVDLLLQRIALVAREVAHLGVRGGVRDHRLDIGEFRRRRAPGLQRADHRFELRQLARQGDEGLAVRPRRKPVVDHRVARQDRVDGVAGNGVGGR